VSQNTVALLKAIADESRLSILVILNQGDCYTELIASRLNLTPATVNFHLKKLEQAGIVNCSRVYRYQFYSLNRDILNQTLLDIIKLEPVDGLDDESAFRESVIKNFFENGRLKSIPVQVKKRRIILEYITEQLEPDREYTEKEINAVISQYHEDYCTIRRELIGWEYVSRADGIYKRIWK